MFTYLLFELKFVIYSIPSGTGKLLILQLCVFFVCKVVAMPGTLRRVLKTPTFFFFSKNQNNKMGIFFNLLCIFCPPVSIHLFAWAFLDDLIVFIIIIFNLKKNCSMSGSDIFLGSTVYEKSPSSGRDKINNFLTFSSLNTSAFSTRTIPMPRNNRRKSYKINRLQLSCMLINRSKINWKFVTTDSFLYYSLLRKCILNIKKKGKFYKIKF